MARKSKHDLAKAKAAKQKKIAIGGSVLLVLLLVYEVPNTMKMLNKHPKPPISSPSSATTSASTTTTTPATASGAPTDPNALAAPSLAGSAAAAAPAPTSSDLVSSVPLKADPGQLQTFEHFAGKDPFAVQAPTGPGSGSGSGPGSGSGSGSKPSGSPPKTPPAPPAPPASPGGPGSPGGSGGSGSTPAPAPTTAVVSLNGELLSVPVGSDFPTSGATYAKVGAIFHLVSLTQTTAKIGIVGGKYADGAGALTLRVKAPVTLQNTADGTRYVLILEPQGTPVGASGSSPSSSAATPPASTTQSTPVVPSGAGG